jgi:DNA-binding transcriptional LysR family regulator
MPVDLRLLRYFVAVADAGSVSAAARAVHVAQPSLSRQLRGLERQLGLSLFDRGEGRLTLSSAGRSFLPVARDLLARADLATRAAAALRTGALRDLTISCPATTLTDVIAPFLATWTDEDPMPSVWERLPARIYPSLEAGADLAVGTAPPPAALASLPLASLPVWAYVRPDHPWASRGSVRLPDLAREHLLVLGTEQHSRQALDAAALGAGLGPDRLTEFTTAEVAQAVAAAGRGVAIVSDDPRFGLVPLRVRHDRVDLMIRLHAAWLPDHHAAGVLADVARRLNAFCESRYAGSRVAGQERAAGPTMST